VCRLSRFEDLSGTGICNAGADCVTDSVHHARQSDADERHADSGDLSHGDGDARRYAQHRYGAG